MHFPIFRTSILLFSFVAMPCLSAELIPPEEYDEDQIEIVEGEDRMVYEYRQNGVLTMIKVVPKNGRAYYMVPADGAPHYESLDHKRKLYPQWVILEW
jgi:hypothetical protein